MNEKYNNLLLQMDNYTKENILIAFSGGVDSSLLLMIACEKARLHGTKVYAVTAHTKLHPMGDVEVAKKVAAEAGAEHRVVYIDELSEAGIENNPIDHCYKCKRTIFTGIVEMAQKMGIRYMLDGTNEDDMHVYRPGIKALKELNIISPLADNMITKKEVRELAEQYNVSVADRPSTPCMATRLPYGVKLDYELLERIDKGEQFIRKLGFYNVRLRVHRNVARIEVDSNALSNIIDMKDKITDYLKELKFEYITLDLEGFRSGSMDLQK